MTIRPNFFTVHNNGTVNSMTWFVQVTAQDAGWGVSVQLAMWTHYKNGKNKSSIFTSSSMSVCFTESEQTECRLAENK